MWQTTLLSEGCTAGGKKGLWTEVAVKMFVRLSDDAQEGIRGGQGEGSDISGRFLHQPCHVIDPFSTSRRTLGLFEGWGWSGFVQRNIKSQSILQLSPKNLVPEGNCQGKTRNLLLLVTAVRRRLQTWLRFENALGHLVPEKHPTPPHPTRVWTPDRWNDSTVNIWNA